MDRGMRAYDEAPDAREPDLYDGGMAPPGATGYHLPAWIDK
jgi:hypothetical protein